MHPSSFYHDSDIFKPLCFIFDPFVQAQIIEMIIFSPEVSSVNYNRCLRWIHNLLQFNLSCHFFCHQIDYTIRLSTPPSGKQQWNQKGFLFWHKSNISITSTVLMEWPWLARMRRAPWAKKYFDGKFHFKIIFWTHLFACFEREPLFGTFSHNSLDIFQCITPASKSGKCFDRNCLTLK